MQIEAAAIQAASQTIDEDFQIAVGMITACEGNIVVGGVGKSGLIGQKISATLASTGSPSHYMHATEALHGDLGRIRPGDVVILLSNSGSTDEVVSLAGVLRQQSLPIVSITATRDSQLARLSDAVLCIGNNKEACPWKLAPTASTAVMLAIGDALALTASHQRAFSPEDFHKRHPGGALGKLLLPVSDILRFRVGENTAVVSQHTSLQAMLETADRYPRRCGAVLIVDHQNALTGIVTDSDLRRLLIQHGPGILNESTGSIMTRAPRFVFETETVQESLRLVREYRLDEIPVVDGQHRPVGVLDVQDLIALKIIGV